MLFERALYICLQLISPRPAGHAGEGFAAAGHLAEADLKPNAWPASLVAGICLTLLLCMKDPRSK